MTTLYDADILLWSEQQAALLRCVAAGERPNDLDWENIIEELESVGRDQFQSVECLLEIALRHLLLAYGAPDSDPARHWLVEGSAALRRARRRVAPSMVSRLDLSAIWDDCFDYATGKLAAMGGASRDLPRTCPFTIEQLLCSPATVAELLAAMAATAPRVATA